MPIRRQYLSPIPDDFALPDVCPARPFVRKQPLAEYDVKLQPGTAGVLPPAPPSRMSLDAATPTRGHQGSARVVRKAAQAVAQYPNPASDVKPALLAAIERYIKDEKKSIEEATGHPLEPGSETSYWVHRNALFLYKSHMKSYEEILSTVIREFDACFRSIQDKAGELARVKAEVLDERHSRDLRIAEMERCHKTEIAAILKDVQKTRVDNLLSVEVDRLRDAIAQRETQLSAAAWENSQLMDVNARLQKECDELMDRQRQSPFVSASLRDLQSIPVSVDSFVTSLSSSLMAALQVIKVLKAQEQEWRDNACQVRELKAAAAGLEADVDTAQSSLQLVREELAAAESLIAQLKRDVAVKEEERQAAVDGSGGGGGTDKRAKLKQDVANLKEAVQLNKKTYKQSLLELFRQVSALERQGTGGASHSTWFLHGRPLIPEGSSDATCLLLRGTAANLVPSEAYTGKAVVEELETLTMELLFRPQLEDVVEASPTSQRGGGGKRASVEEAPVVYPETVDSAAVEEAVLTHFVRKYGAAKDAPVVDGVGRASHRGQAKLLSFMAAVRRLEHHADCRLLGAALKGTLSPAVWPAMRRQSILFKRGLLTLADKAAAAATAAAAAPPPPPPQPQPQPKGDDEAEQTGEEEEEEEAAASEAPPPPPPPPPPPAVSREDILDVICGVAPHKTVDYALKLFHAVCPQGMVPLNLHAFLADNLFGLTELLKVQYLEEVRMFVLQICEGTRERHRAGEPVTRAAVVSLIRAMDPAQDVAEVRRAVAASVPSRARGRAADEGSDEEEIEGVEAFLRRLSAATVWHKRLSCLNRDVLTDLTTLELGTSAALDEAARKAPALLVPA